MEGDTFNTDYETGVWYDMMNGDFAEIRFNNETELVELINPETDSVYWDMSLDEWDDEKHDFRQVPQDAVDDPVNTVRRNLRILQRNDINELSGYPHDEAIALSYAVERVSIEEQ